MVQDELLFGEGIFIVPLGVGMLLFGTCLYQMSYQVTRHSNIKYLLEHEVIVESKGGYIFTGTEKKFEW